jgi:glutamyl-tRNA synthetase
MVIKIQTGSFLNGNSDELISLCGKVSQKNVQRFLNCLFIRVLCLINRILQVTRKFSLNRSHLPKVSNEMSKSKDIANMENKLAFAEDGKVVTRFPPEPSGYLHIGHAKAALLNHYYARKYHGRMILRLDDTNPTNEKVEFTDNILLDLARLGIKPDVVTHTSDYFDQFQELCCKMIREGSAYVDDTPADASAMTCSPFKGPYDAIKGAMVIELDDGESGKYNRVILEIKEMKPDSVKKGDEIHLMGYSNVIIDQVILNHETGTPIVAKGRLASAGASKAISEFKWLPATVSEQRKYGLDSMSKYRSIDENLRLWEEMLAGTTKGLDCCVRASMGMTLKNKCMRDPVIYRCVVDTPHPRFGDKYKAYPTYDFACPVVDAWEGVTHALRTIEYADRNEQYNWFIEQLGLRKVHIYEFSKLNFIYTVLSKRKLKWFVENKFVDGWSDPRFPTIQAVMRRGMTVDALLEFVLTQGASRNANLMEWDKIWAINKSKIDPVVPRYAAMENTAIEFDLSADPTAPTSPSIKTVPAHPKNPDVGTKEIIGLNKIWIDIADAKEIEDGEEITLMQWGNAIVEKVMKDSNGVITKMVGRLNLDGDFKLTKKKLHWLPRIENLVPVKMEYYDYIITKPKIEENDVVEDLINPKSKWAITGFGAKEIAHLKKGDRLQVERKGYFVVDVPASQSKEVVLINIPDGKTKLSPLITNGGK